MELRTSSAAVHRCVCPCRCSPAVWAASRRQRCPSSTRSMFRWSCVETPRTRAAPVCWTPSVLRTSPPCWRSEVKSNSSENFTTHALPAPPVLHLCCVLQIQFPALDIRLSYNDIQLFLAIAKSVPAASTPPTSDLHTAAVPPSRTTTTPKDICRKKNAPAAGLGKVLDHIGHQRPDVTAAKNTTKNVYLISSKNVSFIIQKI